MDIGMAPQIDDAAAHFMQGWHRALLRQTMRISVPQLLRLSTAQMAKQRSWPSSHAGMSILVGERKIPLSTFAPALSTGTFPEKSGNFQHLGNKKKSHRSRRRLRHDVSSSGKRTRRRPDQSRRTAPRLLSGRTRCAFSEITTAPQNQR